jgi:hypothetical protein
MWPFLTNNHTAWSIPNFILLDEGVQFWTLWDSEIVNVSKDDLSRSALWTWPKLHNNYLPLCIFETNEDFWLIFGGSMNQGTKVGRSKESCRCDLWPCDLETEIPFCSVSPKWMKISDWYSAKWCHLLRFRVSTSLALTPVLASSSNYIRQRGCFLAFVLERVTSI